MFPRVLRTIRRLLDVKLPFVSVVIATLAPPLPLPVICVLYVGTSKRLGLKARPVHAVVLEKSRITK